jgi:hypothetical protein
MYSAIRRVLHGLARLALTALYAHRCSVVTHRVGLFISDKHMPIMNTIANAAISSLLVIAQVSTALLSP